MLIFIAILMAAIAVIIVAWPIVHGRPTSRLNDRENDPTLSELMMRREAVLTALKELEFDHAVGKIEEGDFQILNAQLCMEAIKVLKELDQYLGTQTDLEAQLEREIAQRRRRRSPTLAALEAQIEAEVAALRQKGDPISLDGQACPHCGAPLAKEDHFCRRCGTPAPAHKGG